MAAASRQANRVAGVVAANEPMTPEGVLAAMRELVLATQKAAAMPAPKLLSKSEAARLLGVSRNDTIDRLISTGAIRAVLVGKRLRIPAAEVDRFAMEGERRTRPGQPKPPRVQQLRPAFSPRPVAAMSVEEYRRSMKAVKVSDL